MGAVQCKCIENTSISNSKVKLKKHPDDTSIPNASNLNISRVSGLSNRRSVHPFKRRGSYDASLRRSSIEEYLLELVKENDIFQGQQQVMGVSRMDKETWIQARSGFQVDQIIKNSNNLEAPLTAFQIQQRLNGGQYPDQSSQSSKNGKVQAVTRTHSLLKNGIIYQQEYKKVQTYQLGKVAHANEESSQNPRVPNEQQLQKSKTEEISAMMGPTHGKQQKQDLSPFLFGLVIFQRTLHQFKQEVILIIT
ncbi:hypothetical protein FGO68_gene17525 [Halteria grandinella]|uniref:Uncharacterized protein n=1 Tax=Halteria grandinella TaxID=5974 RepID=A0A8J8P6H5_HALGN|nr:hypothetical protein FGO68_gene17525 [Halteria grandinella]